MGWVCREHLGTPGTATRFNPADLESGSLKDFAASRT